MEMLKVIHGPFPKFEQMMEFAFAHAPYTKDAFAHVTADLIFKLIDKDEDLADWAVIEGLARQCGMIVSIHPDHFGGHAWTFELEDE
jgi:hypothetical protein